MIPYWRPSWWAEITAAIIATIANGCGPGAWKIDLIPDKIAHVDIGDGCNQHDIEYWRGGPPRARLIADLRLGVNMAIACYNQGHSVFRFLPVILTYVLAVRVAGRPCWSAQ